MKISILLSALFLCLGILSAQDGPPPGDRGGFGQQGRGPMRPSPIFGALDLDGDGTISAAELKAASKSLLKLDKNGDGKITADEVRPNFGPEGGGERRQQQQENAGGSDDLVQTLMAFDRNGDGKLTKDELPERMQGLFDRADTNHDGVLTKEEIQASTQRQSAARTEREGREGGRPDFARFDPIFAALDTNADGALSSDEIANASTSLLKLDKNNDGQLTADEVRPARGGFGGGRGGDPKEMAHRMMEEFDKDGDGKLTKAELPDRMQATFDQIDTNQDGFVTQDELVQFLQKQGGPSREPR